MDEEANSSTKSQMVSSTQTAPEALVGKTCLNIEGKSINLKGFGLGIDLGKKFGTEAVSRAGEQPKVARSSTAAMGA